MHQTNIQPAKQKSTTAHHSGKWVAVREQRGAWHYSIGMYAPRGANLRGRSPAELRLVHTFVGNTAMGSFVSLYGGTIGAAALLDDLHAVAGANTAARKELK
jgi:hypothetical protein